MIPVTVGILSDLSDDSNLASKSDQITIPSEVEISESSQIIARLYSENEVGAEIQFTGKWADISGMVHKIDEKDGNVEVSLRNRFDPYPEVVCKIDSSQRETVAQLLPGNR